MVGDEARAFVMPRKVQTDPYTIYCLGMLPTASGGVEGRWKRPLRVIRIRAQWRDACSSGVMDSTVVDS